MIIIRKLYLYFFLTPLTHFKHQTYTNNYEFLRYTMRYRHSIVGKHQRCVYVDGKGKLFSEQHAFGFAADRWLCPLQPEKN